MSFGCSSKEYEKFQDRMILKGLGLKSSKKWSTNVVPKLTHKRYSKIDPQTLL